MLTSLLVLVVVWTALEESPHCLKIHSLIHLQVLLKSYPGFRFLTLVLYP